MTRYEKRFVCALGGIFLLLIALLELYAWWANTPPPRPANVPATAGYYGGLATPFPASKTGVWVNCWFDSEKHADRCRVTSVDGRLLYEGIYLPYQRQAPVPERELVIDSKAMNRAKEVVEVNASSQESRGPSLHFIPLVYLRNGEILIPEKAYQEGKKELDELRKAHSPYAPAR